MASERSLLSDLFLQLKHKHAYDKLCFTFPQSTPLAKHAQYSFKHPLFEHPQPTSGYSQTGDGNVLFYEFGLGGSLMIFWGVVGRDCPFSFP